MNGKKAQAITDPQVGMVIVEDDPRGALPKRIVAVFASDVVARAGRDGTGRKSTILRSRLAEGRYKLISEARL